MKSRFRLELVSFLMLMMPMATFADAVFSVSSSPTLAVESGVTELAGSVMLTLEGGTTNAGAIYVFLSPSVPITNSLTTGIQLTATGDLASVQIQTLSSSPSYLALSIPEGAATGSITVSGLRVDLSVASVRSLQALLSVSGGAGNTLINNSINLISATYPGLTVDTGSDTSFRGGAGQWVRPMLTYTVREGYGQAFNSAIGRFGQINSTHIKITVRNLLEGVTLIFPGMVTANETGATLRTPSGRDVALMAEDGELSVLYQFSADGLTSDAMLESFTLRIRAVAGRLERGATAIQASLAPVSASPTDTAIPRFKSLLTPPLERAGIPYEDLYLSGARVAPVSDTGLVFANPLRTDIRVTFRALTPAGSLLTGPGINNPVVRSIAARGQLTIFASSLFNLPTDFEGTFSIKATTEFEGAFALFSFFSTRDLAIQGGLQAGNEPRREFILSKITSDPAEFTSIHLFNPNDRPTPVILDFINRQGQTVESAPVTLSPNGAYNADTRLLFSPGTLSEGGYVLGRSESGVIGTATFGQGPVFAGLSAQESNATFGPELPVAHFVQGGGFYTEVNLINRADTAIEVAVRALDDRGELLRDPEIGENPARFRMAANGQFVSRLSDLFRMVGNRLISGRLEFEVLTFRGFHQMHFSMAGSLVIGSDSRRFLAALPLVISPARQLFFAQVVEASGVFTGLALLNPNDRVSSNLTISVYRPDGTLVGSKTLTLRPQERLVNLVRELIPEAFGLRSGMIRVRSSEHILGYSLVGSERLDFLTAGPPQRKD